MLARLAHGLPPGMTAPSLKTLSTGALCLLTVACASYPERTRKALGDFQRGQLARAQGAYENPKTTGSAFLAGAESGTVALAAGDWQGAIRNLSAAAADVQATERSALISPESLGESILSWTVNEGARRYPGEGYERVMVHTGLAAAYLARGDLEAARVEVRQSNALLESEEKLYDKEYQAGGFGHFLSAITYELDGQYDDAWIDYERMRKKGVGKELASRALARLAEGSDRERELGSDFAAYRGSGPDRDAASIVVLAGVGLAPFKRATTIPVPTDKGILQWSVPSYAERPQPVSALELSVPGGNATVRTVVVEDVGRVARENLQDRIAWLVAKSTVRTFLKRELTRHLEKKAGILGRIAGDLFTLVTERADLRSWETLPDSWQAARAFVPAGRHDLRLEAVGGECQDLGSFELARGETMFVFARTIGTRLYAYPVGGRVITPEPLPAAP